MQKRTTMANNGRMHTADRPNWALAPPGQAASSNARHKLNHGRKGLSRKPEQDENIQPKISDSCAYQDGENISSNGHPARKERPKRARETVKSHSSETPTVKHVQAQVPFQENEMPCSERADDQESLKKFIHAVEWIQPSNSDVDIPRLINPYSPKPPHAVDQALSFDYQRHEEPSPSITPIDASNEGIVSSSLMHERHSNPRFDQNGPTVGSSPHPLLAHIMKAELSHKEARAKERVQSSCILNQRKYSLSELLKLNEIPSLKSSSETKVSIMIQTLLGPNGSSRSIQRQ